MAFKIIWSETAIEDLREIVMYISHDDLNAANSLADRVLNRVELASKHPFSNRVVPEKKDDSIRESILSPYRIVYHIDLDNDIIGILRIWHSARGIPDLG